IRLTDGVAPRVAGTDLPAAGSASTALVAGLTISFSEPVDAATVAPVLRSAGPDGVLGSGDDVTFSLTRRVGAGGTTVGFDVDAGALPPGRYRLTLPAAAAADRVGNRMAEPYVRDFELIALPGFVSE
ncbi:Ig-like domain-containing protein, partial [Aquisphaera insulae]|uniref:Ig-like domain-containing protein n=1 Tax=Aquisphaera insulae TaxID=2712864 RepID=UPI0013EAD810